MLLFLLFFLLFLAADLYLFYGYKFVLKSKNNLLRLTSKITFWIVTPIFFTLIGLVRAGFFSELSPHSRNITITIFFIITLSKTFLLIFLLIDDIRRGIKWGFRSIKKVNIDSSAENNNSTSQNTISRSGFLLKSGLVVASLPIATTSYGILSGAHDYRVRKKTLFFPNLPSSFDGIKLAQLSDIHSGSFYNKTAVQGGIDMLLNEKPDIIFFTGDLVNNKADEMINWVDVFAKVKAPLGVYSTLGNHDYGDYVMWKSSSKKEKNLMDLKATHSAMEWNLLNNSHKKISVNNEEIAILGVENWSAKARFPKYGSLIKAYEGTEDIPFKVLLSHDPSHWEAEVISKFTDIDITLSGHTHGMQFGVEIGDFRWSPIQYMYDQWADLYKKGNQYLYVNRGFGFIGFPGRIGILPEITLLTLKKTT